MGEKQRGDELLTYLEYSVLMSVYIKESPEYLRIAIDSMLKQTIPPSEFVIVQDGPLTDRLYMVIDEFRIKFPGLFRIVAYQNNYGLGYALQKGICACTKEIVARMDSDDWASPVRMEVQLSVLQSKNLDMIGSQVTEFLESPDAYISITNLPENHDEIRDFSKRRNPFRHPAMVYRRDMVIKAGNYSTDFLYFEDWDLFNRMLSIGCKAANVHEPLVAMRVGEDFYARRGGVRYLKQVWMFKMEQVRNGYFTLFDFISSFAPQLCVCLLPNNIRARIYKKLLRK